ncbi:MAG TPA: NUDIX domain-containing protein [Candidatus Saccharimonadales bacterium]|nr:NUDIX domain-containing protein [Candidatus Saccharimonadales bacterium]
MAPSAQQYEVLDDAGHKTGQLLGSAEVHKQELWHEVANVWVINSRGEVLLQLRSPEVELCPNVWDVAVGTHVRPAEDPAAAAIRGLHDEIGLTVLPEKLQHLFNIQAANPMHDGRKHKVLGHVFLLKQDVDAATLKVDPSKIAELAWKPVSSVMAEIGATDTAAQYFPREGTYYPQLFDVLLANAPPELA